MFSKLRQAISIEHIILISSATYLYRNSFGLEVFSLGFRFPLQRSLIVFSRFIGLLWVKRKREKCIYVIPFFTDIDCSVVIKLYKRIGLQNPFSLDKDWDSRELFYQRTANKVTVYICISSRYLIDLKKSLFWYNLKKSLLFCVFSATTKPNACLFIRTRTYLWLHSCGIGIKNNVSTYVLIQVIIFHCTKFHQNWFSHHGVIEH